MQSSSQSSRSINGVDTELIIQNYADKTLVLVSQLGKIGNLIQVSLPSTTPLSPFDTSNGFPQLTVPPAIDVKQILGSASSESMGTLYTLYASHIATLLWCLFEQNQIGGDRRSVIVGIALKQFHKDQNDSEGPSDEVKGTFRAVMKMIVDLQNKTA